MLEFFAMGGHGFYVWASWGGGALVLLLEVLMLRAARRRQWRRLQRAQRLEQS